MIIKGIDSQIRNGKVVLSPVNGPSKLDPDKLPARKAAIPRGHQYLPHTGRNARIRNLTRACKHILTSKDPEVQDAVKAAREYITTNGEGPFTEYGVLMILHTAKEIAESAEGVSIADSIQYVVHISRTKKESEMQEATTEAFKPEEEVKPLLATEDEDDLDEVEDDEDELEDEDEEDGDIAETGEDE